MYPEQGEELYKKMIEEVSRKQADINIRKLLGEQLLHLINNVYDEDSPHKVEYFVEMMEHLVQIDDDPFEALRYYSYCSREIVPWRVSPIQDIIINVAEKMSKEFEFTKKVGVEALKFKK